MEKDSYFSSVKKISRCNIPSKKCRSFFLEIEKKMLEYIEEKRSIGAAISGLLIQLQAKKNG